MGTEAQGRGAGPCWQEAWALEATDLPLTKRPHLSPPAPGQGQGSEPQRSHV